MKKAIIDLGQHQQPQLVGDIFEIYFKEHVQKMQKTVENYGEIEDAFLFQLSMLMFEHSEKKRAVILLETVASTCVSKEFTEENQKIC